jgi:LmbE family N-acetylglucosaminyl deacetylase
MTGPNVPHYSTLVMAHPDDEALWASSILSHVGQIVFCFEQVSSVPALGEGRRKSLAALPLPSIVSLGLRESEVFDSAHWPEPAETAFGLDVQLHPRSNGGFSKAVYIGNHARLVKKLRPVLSTCCSVVTHSPWGEYGHEEHVQVFRAVADLQRQLGFTLWIPGYVSNKSCSLMLRHLPRLDPAPRSYTVDREIGSQLQSVYADNGCWTWFSDYVWPEREYFYQWRNEDRTSEHSRAGACVPMNMLWLDWAPPSRPPLPRLHRFLGRVKRRVLRI